MNFVKSNLIKNESIKSLYQKGQFKNRIFLLFLLVMLFMISIIALQAGSYDVSFVEIIKGVFNQSDDAKVNLLIQQNRLPRILTAIVSGAGLGLAGCVLQAILHNPLASPSTLGVSQGANFGAALAIIGLGVGASCGFVIPIFAFISSLLVAFIAADEELMNLHQTIQDLYSSYIIFTDDEVITNQEQEILDKDKMLDLLAQLNNRLEKLNDGSFTVDDRETERVKKL